MCVSFRRAGRGWLAWGWHECGACVSVGLSARDARFQAVLPASRSKNQPICTKPERDARFQAVLLASRSIVSVLPEHTRRRVGNVEDFV